MNGGETLGVDPAGVTPQEEEAVSSDGRFEKSDHAQSEGSNGHVERDPTTVRWRTDSDLGASAMSDDGGHSDARSESVAEKQQGPLLAPNEKERTPVRRDACSGERTVVSRGRAIAANGNQHRLWNLKHMQVMPSAAVGKVPVCYVCRKPPGRAAMVCERPELARVHVFCFSCLERAGDGYEKAQLTKGTVKVRSLLVVFELLALRYGSRGE